MSSEQQIRREILAQLASAPVTGLRRNVVLKRLGNVDSADFNRIFNALINEGIIAKKRGGRYVEAAVLSQYIGVFTRNPRGFGFVTLESGGNDIFIRANNTLDAMSGDQVLISINDEHDKRGISGTIIKILERARPYFVGTLEEQNGAVFVRPLRRDLPAIVPLTPYDPALASSYIKTGDWVVASFLPQKDPQHPLNAILSTKVARPNGAAGIISAVCKEFAIPHKYTAPSEKAAAALVPLKLPREDCRNMLTFTIDPVDARDYDDAISYRKLDELHAEIGVHIADVACFVQHGSKLDLNARQRGFTTYMPGRTVGMLPDALSSNKCSLVEGKERLAHSVFLTVNVKNGEVLDSRRTHTLIKSQHRLNYEQVDRLLDGEQDPTLDEEITRTLKSIADIAASMRRWRATHEMFLPFVQSEIRVLCSGSPLQIIGITQAHSGQSAEMIEEMMLAANVQVALEMQKRNIKGLFRNHAAPSPDELNEISTMAAAVTHDNCPNLTSRNAMVNFLTNLKNIPAGAVLSIAAIKSMPRAEYAFTCQGHYGLGKSVYCHFTSPIRRYPDLFTHQQLIQADIAAKPLDASPAFAVNCNALEYNIDQAGFSVSDRLKLQIIQNNPHDTVYQCLISRLSQHGITLYLSKYGLMGFIKLSALPGFWQFDSKLQALKCRAPKQTLRFGDTMLAHVASVDTVRGELFLEPERICF